MPKDTISFLYGPMDGLRVPKAKAGHVSMFVIGDVCHVYQRFSIGSAPKRRTRMIHTAVLRRPK